MSKQLLPIMTANGSFENLRRGGYVYVESPKVWEDVDGLHVGGDLSREA